MSASQIRSKRILLRMQSLQQEFAELRRRIIEAMKTDLSDEEVKMIVEALEHYYAYTRAKQREDTR